MMNQLKTLRFGVIVLTATFLLALPAIHAQSVEGSTAADSILSEADRQEYQITGNPIKSHNELAPCAEMVSGCIRLAEVDRSSCYFSGSQHPFCLGTPLGELMHSRWLTSARPSIGDASLGFLGTHIVNTECLSSFDQSFLGLLDKVTTGDRTSHQVGIEAVTAKLKSCNRDVTLELSMP